MHDELLQALGQLPRKAREHVGGRVAHHARQVFFGVPAHVVSQPVDFSGQLHIAFNAHGRLVAPQRGLRQAKWRFLGDGQGEVRRGGDVGPVKQACRRCYQFNS